MSCPVLKSDKDAAIADAARAWEKAKAHRDQPHRTQALLEVAMMNVDYAEAELVRVVREMQ